jgi:hypothetical protein
MPTGSGSIADRYFRSMRHPARAFAIGPAKHDAMETAAFRHFKTSAAFFILAASAQTGCASIEWRVSCPPPHQNTAPTPPSPWRSSSPPSSLDWPVRLLVTQEDDGSVWTVYSDFGWIARRHGIKNRDAQFKMASQVIASITSSVTAKKAADK